MVLPFLPAPGTHAPESKSPSNCVRHSVGSKKGATEGYVAMLERSENKRETVPLPEAGRLLTLERHASQKTKKSQDGEGTNKQKLIRIPDEGHVQEEPGRTWYWEREGSSPAPPRPRRRTTRKELPSPSHRKSSPPRPKTRFLVSNCGGGGSGGGDEDNDEEAGFSASAGLWFFSPSRSRKNTTWLGSQVCHSSPSPEDPSAVAILAQLLPRIPIAQPAAERSQSAAGRPLLRRISEQASRKHEARLIK